MSTCLEGECWFKGLFIYSAHVGFMNYAFPRFPQWDKSLLLDTRLFSRIFVQRDGLVAGLGYGGGLIRESIRWLVESLYHV